ncbi:MAG: hypothetical protein V8T09_05535 [Oscillospiraceae bacterium]
MGFLTDWFNKGELPQNFSGGQRFRVAFPQKEAGLAAGGKRRKGEGRAAEGDL